MDSPGRELLHIQPEFPHHVPGQADRIGLVVYGKGRLVTEGCPFPAQYAHAGGMKSGDPHALGHRPHQRRHPFAHFVGGFVGKGDGQDGERGHPFLAHQPSDPVRQHPGLARAGTGDDQQRATRMGDGLYLGWVEALQERLARGSLSGSRDRRSR